MPDIKKIVVKQMKLQKINQSKLAELSGLSRPTISRCLQGKVNLTIKTLAKLGCALNTRWSFSLTDDVKMVDKWIETKIYMLRS